MHRLISLFGVAIVLVGGLSAAADPVRVLPEGQLPQDSRLGKPKDLNGYFPFAVPATKEAWEARREQVRTQVLVGNGLWPLPAKMPLNAVIHGKIDRDDYTIEKVFFASYPGHYVTGNLYRPKNRAGKLPGVLSPHGHWNNGRFYENIDKAIEKEVASGAEKTKEGAKYPLQARQAQLARMGCVVFHYDMVGYADSQQIKHREGFKDAEAELRLQNFMGLQTWNSIRALDFLLSLPDVDGTRIGVSGASGGGTQTFLLCGIDDRPTAAFPAVMVSTAMQGGCVCENCSYLRLGTGNIELAGLFAPKPLAMSGANDWTKEIETKGLPELKQLYKLYNAEEQVAAKAWLEFGHNYNQVAREFMYNWFNKHLKLNQPEPVVEKPFVPVPPKELAVFDEQHPLPKDAVDAEVLRKYLTESSDKQMQALIPKDAAGVKEYQRIIGGALRTLIADTLPAAADVEDRAEAKPEEKDGIITRKLLLTRKGQGEAIPAVGLRGKEHTGAVVVWIHPDGKRSLWKDGKLVPAAQQIIDAKGAILAPDVFMTGEFEGAKLTPVNPGYAGFTFGYNRSLLANRVHDILTAVAFAKGHRATKQLHLVGWGSAGPWTVLARGLCGDAVARTAVDIDGCRFEKVRTTTDDMMLPGALKYGGLPAFAGLCAPGELFTYNQQGTGMGKWVKGAYEQSGAAERLQSHGDAVSAEKVVGWLLR